MEKDILELIYNYSINAKLADPNFVDKLVEIIVNHKNLNEYVKDIHFYEGEQLMENNKIQLASYNIVDRFMAFNVATIREYLEIYGRNYSSYFSDVEQMFYNNLLISHIILHELEHADQNKKYNSAIHNTENTLIRIAFRGSYLFKDPLVCFKELTNMGYTLSQIDIMLKQRRNLYKEYYNYNPTERLADIKSYNTLAKSLSHLKKQMPNLYEYEYINYMKSLISGYDLDTLQAPTITYVGALGFPNDWSKFHFYDEDPQIMMDQIFDQHSFIERLAFGLPVTYGEYDKAQKVLSLNNRFD